MKKDKIKVLTPVKAMRAKCLDCCCGSTQEVREYRKNMRAVAI